MAAFLHLMWRLGAQRREIQQPEDIIRFFRITDYESPSPDTVAGRALSDNMEKLRVLGLPASHPQLPVQKINAMGIPENYMLRAKAVIAGSPADKAPSGLDRGTCSPRRFKTNCFYSWLYYTSPQTLCVMTWSKEAVRGGLEFWMDRPDDGRFLLIHRAFFRRYMPRRGTEGDLQALGSQEGTMVAILAPPSFSSCLTWTADHRIDVAASVVNWARRECQFDEIILFLAAFTAELELDIAEFAAHAA